MDTSGEVQRERGHMFFSFSRIGSLIRPSVLFPLFFLFHSPSLLLSQTPWSWHWLLLCAGFSVSVWPILLPPCLSSWSSHGLFLSPYFYISLHIPIRSCNLLYAYGSQAQLFIYGVTPCLCYFMSLSLCFQEWRHFQKQTAAPLLQKIFSYSFILTAILFEFLWYKTLKLVLISLPFLPSFYVHINILSHKLILLLPF